MLREAAALLTLPARDRGVSCTRAAGSAQIARTSSSRERMSQPQGGNPASGSSAAPARLTDESADSGLPGLAGEGWL